MAGAAAGLAIALMAPAAGAQTCSIEPAYKSESYAGYWLASLQSGEVITFGDLRIRGAVIGRSLEDSNGAIAVDLKAPGFAQSQAWLPENTPQRFTICGQDVTLTMSWIYGSDRPQIRVGVF